MKNPGDILDAYKSGMIGKDEASSRLLEACSTDLLHSKIDDDRELRTGAAEVIYGEGKSAGQIAEIAGVLLEHGANVLITRIDQEKASEVNMKYPDAVYHGNASLLEIRRGVRLRESDSFIAVVSAGTSDGAVADEAALTAEFFGSRVERFYDCGVAGLHRLLSHIDRIRQARVVVAVAGMEGALPSVLAGLVKAPVIAVPTSVGYGMNLNGAATLLAMMNSCANGISVVNVDNGFGAGYNAHVINML